MIVRCPHCQKQTTVEAPGNYICPSCSQRFKVSPENFEWEQGARIGDEPGGAFISGDSNLPEGGMVPPGGSSSYGPVGGPVPEALPDLTRENFWSLLKPYVMRIVKMPSLFFTQMPVPGTFWPAIGYAILVSLPGKLVEALVGLVMSPGRMAGLEQTLKSGELADIPGMEEYIRMYTDMLGGGGTMSAMVIAGIVLTPLTVFLSSIVGGAVYHAIIAILGEHDGNFEDTIRVTAYSNTANLARVIPFVGASIAFIWQLVLTAIGLTKVHRVPGWKGAVAVIAPIVICCCGFAVLGMGIAGMIGGMSAH
ncbi:MAG: YIP1 family protein [Deltaproteobacteria bacterium]|nr:YIP1 family protein [Deltaproteobacteria bacterium]MCB9488403.1 YIP1 family protein [Deltaproteobacteria bacterium]